MPDPAPSPAPETVTEAVAFLAEQGYVDEFRLCATGVLRHGDDEPHPAEGTVIDYTFRFEGPTDPGDEAIVLGLRCAGWGAKGVVISAYGPDADPDEAALLRTLADAERRH